jgi:predicted nucleic acid-binding protein
MTEAPVLPDTSAWVEFLRGRGDAEVIGAVRLALRQRAAVTCGLVVVEMLVGARTLPQFEQVQGMLCRIPQLPITADCWDRAASWGFRLRRRGITAPTTDLIIAATAHVHGAELLHCDRHFDLIASVAEDDEPRTT